MSKRKSVLVIAEAGVNHNGDLDIARQLVNAAAEAGADLVKFQTFNAESLVTPDAPKAGYQTRATNKLESQREMLRSLELSPEAHSVLLSYCKNKNIGFFSTGFDIQSLDFLASLGAESFKIPSGEITNLPYLRHVGSYGKPVIVSTGMASMSEIEGSICALESAGLDRGKITVLHCNTAYPTPMIDVNLLAMCSIKEAFGVEVGYSDHTLGFEVAIAAVALGATVIEKHFTLDRRLVGPDHKSSLEPIELKSMIRAIRNIELAMGDGVKRPSRSEKTNIPIVRKSLVASKDIKAGEIFTSKNVTVKRPGTGISPMRWDDVMGQFARRDFVVDELISL